MEEQVLRSRGVNEVPLKGMREMEDFPGSGWLVGQTMVSLPGAGCYRTCHRLGREWRAQTGRCWI